jgi:hypothetical protein
METIQPVSNTASMMIMKISHQSLIVRIPCFLYHYKYIMLAKLAHRLKSYPSDKKKQRSTNLAGRCYG